MQHARRAGGWTLRSEDYSGENDPQTFVIFAVSIGLPVARTLGWRALGLFVGLQRPGRYQSCVCLAFRALQIHEGEDAELHTVTEASWASPQAAVGREIGRAHV